MEDLKKRILEISRKANVASLATVTTKGTPWVRYVEIKAQEDLTFKCATYRNSRKVHQIEKNSEVHLTLGLEKFMEVGAYLQIEGEAVVSNDIESREAFWSERLRTHYTGPEDPDFAVITIKPRRIEVWGRESTPEVVTL